MGNKELVRVINRQTGSGFSDALFMPELEQKLTVFINDLIQNDFQKLVTILYKIDVDENRLKRILTEKGGKDAAGIITGLIIERELQKIKTRKQFN